MITEHDKHYILLNEIESAQNCSQRDLSQRTGLSLGTVNLLLQKMIREGLVKMDTIPAKRVVYMLTPKGIAEKAVKTVHYIRNHYRMIENTKKLIRNQLETYHSQYQLILICLPGNELDDMLCDVANEYRLDHPDRNLQVIKHHSSEIVSPKYPARSTIVLYLPSDGQADCMDYESNESMTFASLLDTPN